MTPGTGVELHPPMCLSSSASILRHEHSTLGFVANVPTVIVQGRPVKKRWRAIVRRVSWPLRDGRFETVHASLLRESAIPRRLIASWGVG